MFISNPLATSNLERDRWAPPRPGRFTYVQENLPIVRGVRWVSGPVLTRMKYTVSEEIRSPKRQPVSSRYIDYIKCLLVNSVSRRTGLKPKVQL
jgi:hypothetical protein